MIGPDKDIPAPDMGTNAQVMAWAVNQYEKYHGFSPACITGKPLELHGSQGREEATGRGVIIVTEAVLKQLQKTLAGSTVALQGFGNVGSFAARFLHEAGARVVAISDVAGGICNPDGLDIPAVIRWNGDPKGWRDSPAPMRSRTKSCCGRRRSAHSGGAGGASSPKMSPARFERRSSSRRRTIPRGPKPTKSCTKRDVVVVPDILAQRRGGHGKLLRVGAESPALQLGPGPSPQGT